MKHISKHILLIAAYAFLIFIAVLSADEFRVKRIQKFLLNDAQFEPFSVNLGYDDALAFILKDIPVFLEGIEIEVKLSQEHLSFLDAFAYSTYTNVSPSPSPTITKYSGDMQMYGVLPNRSSHIIRIPIQDTRLRQGGAYRTDTAYLQRSKMPQSILFRFYPGIKNLPNKFEHITFKVTVRPILANLGGLKLHFQFPEKEQKPIKVQIDKEHFTTISDIQFLKPGNYLINITSDHYRSEVRSCVIEKGKITEVSVVLKSLISELYIDAIKGVSIFMDGKKIDDISKPLIVTPELHRITFKIGNYEIVRQLDIREGKKYHVTMTFDVSLEEME